MRCGGERAPGERSLLARQTLPAAESSLASRGKWKEDSGRMSIAAALLVDKQMQRFSSSHSPGFKGEVLKTSPGW